MIGGKLERQRCANCRNAHNRQGAAIRMAVPVPKRRAKATARIWAWAPAVSGAASTSSDIGSSSTIPNAKSPATSTATTQNTKKPQRARPGRTRAIGLARTTDRAANTYSQLGCHNKRQRDQNHHRHHSNHFQPALRTTAQGARDICKPLLQTHSSPNAATRKQADGMSRHGAERRDTMIGMHDEIPPIRGAQAAERPMSARARCPTAQEASIVQLNFEKNERCQPRAATNRAERGTYERQQRNSKSRRGRRRRTASARQTQADGNLGTNGAPFARAVVMELMGEHRCRSRAGKRQHYGQHDGNELARSRATRTDGALAERGIPPLFATCGQGEKQPAVVPTATPDCAACHLTPPLASKRSRPSQVAQLTRRRKESYI